jgi:translation initiation factor 2 subunit 1
MNADENKEGKYHRPNPNVNLKCRFYEDKYPSADDLVVVEIKDVVDNGAYVRLLEYNNIEGMITPNEYSTVKWKSLHKLFKVGTEEIVMVLRVDTEKGYIDLSKKRVLPEQINEARERYRKAKLVHNILWNVADKTGIDLEKLYEEIGWPLYKKFNHAYDAFRMSLEEPEKVFGDIKMTEDVKKKLFDVIKLKLAPQAMEIRADFELTCFTAEGIDGIKEALREGLKKATPQVNLQLKVKSAPIYMAFATTREKNEGVRVVTEALEAIEAKIKEKKGTYILKEAPRVIGDKGEKDIQEMIKALEQRPVSDDEEDNDEAMNVDVEGMEETGKKSDDDDEEEEDDDKE